MKTFSFVLLAGSLLLNAALLMVLAAGVSTEPAAAPAVAEVQPAAKAVASTTTIDANTWSSLHTADMPTLVARLREAGFPPAMIRAVLQAQLEEDYTARRRAAQPNADAVPYWKNVQLDPATEATLRQLSREQQKKMAELLGPDGVQTDPLSRARENRQLAHLAPEKAEQVRQVFREFNEMRNDVYANFMGGILAPAEREKIQAIEKRQTEAVAQLLTPSEFEEFELRGSSTANSLRSRLLAFDATEEEFRALFRLQRPFDQQLGPIFGPMTPEESRRRSELQKQLDEQIKAALGPVRAAEFERAANYEYSRTTQLVARLQLPPETTNQLWTLQQEFQKRSNELRGDRALTAEQRTSQLQAMAAEAANRLTPLLGPRGIEAYKQNGGFWLNNLMPPARPPAAPAPAR